MLFIPDGADDLVHSYIGWSWEAKQTPAAPWMNQGLDPFENMKSSGRAQTSAKHPKQMKYINTFSECPPLCVAALVFEGEIGVVFL